MMLFFFFFFQAEDGIRDKLVTGVQTCALPICQRTIALSLPGHGRPRTVHIFPGPYGRVQHPLPVEAAPTRVDGEIHALQSRSEERRVGKECRSRWWPES